MGILQRGRSEVNHLLLLPEMVPGSSQWELNVEQLRQCHLLAVERGHSEMAEIARQLLIAYQQVESVLPNLEGQQ